MIGRIIVRSRFQAGCYRLTEKSKKQLLVEESQWKQMMEAVACVMWPASTKVEMRWWQIRKRNADLERELRSDLEFEEEQRERGLLPKRRPMQPAVPSATSLICEQTHETFGLASIERFWLDLLHAPSIKDLDCFLGVTLVFHKMRVCKFIDSVVPQCFKWIHLFHTPCRNPTREKAHSCEQQSHKD